MTLKIYYKWAVYENVILSRPPDKHYKYTRASCLRYFSLHFDLKMSEAELQLPKLVAFYGQKDKDTVSAKVWALAVDYAQLVENLDDEKAATLAAASLHGVAGKMMYNIR